MIDLLTMTRLRLLPEEIDEIVTHNHLQTNSKDGVICYDNLKTKNLGQHDGLMLVINTSGKLKVEGSLQKYYNKKVKGISGNFNLFNMDEAMEAIDMMISDKHLPSDMLVYGCEIGLNLNVSKDCQLFIDRMTEIGPPGDERKWYVNARYVKPRDKDERMKTTSSHKDVRKLHKVYDKCYEMHDRKSKYIPDGNILRIETVHRRMENKPVKKFFEPDNLYRMVELFFRDWRTIKFEQDISTPKGTGRMKKDLCKQILIHGRDEVLKSAREKNISGALTDKEYRNIREFIQKDYDDLKKEIVMIRSPEECEYRSLLSNHYSLLRR